jgi:hypothetical protein
MNEEMRKRRGLLVLGLSALLALSCSHGILEDIKADVEEAKLGGKPVINVFQLETPSPTNNRTVSFQLAGSAIATGWYVGEASSAPVAGSPEWVSATPSQYTLSAGDGEKTVSAWAKSSTGELSDPKTVTVVLDQTRPVIDSFVLTSPSETSDANVAFTLSASDAIGITKWLINESLTPPSVNDPGWITAMPTTYTVSAGSGTKTVYAWARDGAGNVSSSKSIALTYNDPGRTPVILSFARTSASPTNALLVTFTLTGNVDATRWIVNESAAAPLADDTGWDPSPAPSDHTLTGSDGPRTLYAWAKNDFGVVSASLSISVVLDRVEPSITPPNRTSPADSESRVVAFDQLTGTDANGITAWFLKENSSTPSLGDSGWVSSAPSSFTVSTSYGLHTISIWARDAAGNISDPATIFMTLWPTPAATLQGGTERVGHEPIELRFNASMNTGSVTVTGDLSACSKQWTTTTLSNDTLTLTPTTLWPSGSGKTLTIDGSSAQSIAMATFNAGFTVFYRIYVNDTNGGNDSNVGSSLFPKATVRAALTAASTSYVPANAVDVLVAKGLYQADFNASTFEVARMVEKASVYGGYAEDFASRDPVVNATTLRDTSAAGGATRQAANRAVFFGSGISSATVLDGFTVQAGTGGSYCAAILCDGSASSCAPLIRNCTIVGGQGTSGVNSVGILNWYAGPEITGCAINGASGTNSFGIYNYSTPASFRIHHNASIVGGTASSITRGIYNVSSSPIISCNWILGGDSSPQSYGIHNTFTSAPGIYDNTISGGTTSSGTGANTTYGVYNSASSPDIRNNTIDGGIDASVTTSNPSCIYNLSGSTPIIENNILFIRGGYGYGYGVYDSGSTDNPSSIKNNDFDGLLTSGSNGLYYDAGTPYTDIALLNSSIGGASGNVNVNAQFLDRAGYDWHLTGSTPVSVSQGGLDLSGVINFPDNPGHTAKIDKDDVSRTAPWSMGAYEKD